MPARVGRLDEATIKMLALYLHALGGGEKPPSGPKPEGQAVSDMNQMVPERETKSRAEAALGLFAPSLYADHVKVYPRAVSGWFRTEIGRACCREIVCQSV